MIEAAEVVSVSYKDDSIEGLYQLRCRLLSDRNAISKDYAPIVARPINSSFKQPPLKGEVVLLLKGPSNISSKNLVIPEWYYLQPLNIQSSIHHNALPSIGSVESKSTQGSKSTTANYQQTQAGNPDRNGESEQQDLGTFQDNDEIRPLQPYEGDVLVEGRFGQSIRFGSTIDDDSEKYSTETHWEKTKGRLGDPITIIRNGQKTEFLIKPDSNHFINENINFDDSSIYFTSTQEIPLAKASGDTIALDSLGLTKSTFDGKQLLLSSDRIVLNSREKDTLIFAGGGIGLSSPQGITFDSSGKGINMAGSVINLGSNAKEDGEPAVLGETLNERLDAMADTIAQLADACGALTVGTGTGPSTPPINLADFNKISKTDVTKLKQKHPDVKSKYVYLKKEKDYNSIPTADTPKKNR